MPRPKNLLLDENYDGRNAGRKEVTGHRSGYDALVRGEAFRGLALAKEQDVIAELDATGVDALIERNVVRLQTVADLYYDAILCAEQQGRIQTLDRYLKTHASLTERANRGLELLRALHVARDGDAIDYEKILEAQRND